jgi:hypothetical protein
MGASAPTAFIQLHQQALAWAPSQHKQSSLRNGRSSIPCHFQPAMLQQQLPLPPAPAYATSEPQAQPHCHWPWSPPCAHIIGKKGTKQDSTIPSFKRQNIRPISSLLCCAAGKCHRQHAHTPCWQGVVSERLINCPLGKCQAAQRCLIQR